MRKPFYEDDSVTLYHGDCRQVMAALPSDSLDACVTDPPYELRFMNRQWDSNGIAYDRDVWVQVWRVLKPGGHLLAFGGTRTWHRLACAIEDAGFEIRDSIAWMYGSGFPKSLDVSKAIDKANGRQFEDRFVLGRHIRERREASGMTRAEVNAWFGYASGCEHWESQNRHGARIPTLADWRLLSERLSLSEEWLPLVERAEAEREVVCSDTKARSTSGKSALPTLTGSTVYETWDITAPATPAAQQWQGWGTALKPAFEPIVVARKPLIGTVAENVLAHGTGALNIDGCRVGFASDADEAESKGKNRHADFGSDAGGNAVYGDYSMVPRTNYNPTGRWPANVILDESQAAELDRQSGIITSAPAKVGKPSGTTFGGGEMGCQEAMLSYGDSGGASRFFYTAKANSDERPRVDGVAHPTVKPLDLMRHLVRLVTPPGGTVLEPFAGSGTTAEACIVEGFKCIAIEMTDDYLPLITARITKPIQVTLL